MNKLMMEILKDDKPQMSKQMCYNNDREFFTALVTLCDELGVEVPIWTTSEERILKKRGQLELEMDNGLILKICSSPAE